MYLTIEVPLEGDQIRIKFSRSVTLDVVVFYVSADSARNLDQANIQDKLSCELVGTARATPAAERHSRARNCIFELVMPADRTFWQLIQV